MIAGVYVHRVLTPGCAGELQIMESSRSIIPWSQGETHDVLDPLSFWWQCVTAMFLPGGTGMFSLKHLIMERSEVLSLLFLLVLL